VTRMLGATVAVLTATLALPLAAQEMSMTPTTCPSTPVELPNDLAGWANPTPLVAAGAVSDLGTAQLTNGKAVTVALLLTPDVRFHCGRRNPRQREPCGLLSFAVTVPGIYRVALGPGHGSTCYATAKTIESGAHNHGPVLGYPQDGGFPTEIWALYSLRCQAMARRLCR